MIELWNTYHNTLVSKHRTLVGAMRKQRQHKAKAKAQMGVNLTYRIVDAQGWTISPNLILEAETILDSE